MWSGQAPQVTFTVNGNEHRDAYWLADGIYPTYASFVKTVSKPTLEEKSCLPQSKRLKGKTKNEPLAFCRLVSTFFLLAVGCGTVKQWG
jgi:Plant transposon protein